jgi:hypothetical protein
MAINSNLLRRPSDRSLFLAAAILFPLLVLTGYFRSYYFRPFFTDKPLSGILVHAHGVTMSLWVIYFTAQIVLIRTKNVRLHMTMGLVGVGLAILAVVTGLAAAYNAHLIRGVTIPGVNPNSFFLVPVTEMILFVIYLAGAIYYRKQPAEHKTLMLMTAINFLPPALGRINFMPPGLGILWSWGMPDLLALACFGWFTWKHRKVNKIFLGAVLLYIASQAMILVVGRTSVWLEFAGWLASLK